MEILWPLGVAAVNNSIMEAPASVGWTVCRSLVEQWQRAKDLPTRRREPAVADDAPKRAPRATQARHERLGACTLAGVEDT